MAMAMLLHIAPKLLQGTTLLVGGRLICSAYLRTPETLCLANTYCSNIVIDAYCTWVNTLGWSIWFF